jgi:hypothetical protein
MTDGAPDSAIVHPLCRRIWLVSAAAYLPACSHGSTRAKHGRSNPSSSARFRVWRQPVWSEPLQVAPLMTDTVPWKSLMLRT